MHLKSDFLFYLLVMLRTSLLIQDMCYTIYNCGYVNKVSMKWFSLQSNLIHSYIIAPILKDIAMFSFVLSGFIQKFFSASNQIFFVLHCTTNVLWTYPIPSRVLITQARDQIRLECVLCIQHVGLLCCVLYLTHLVSAIVSSVDLSNFVFFELTLRSVGQMSQLSCISEPSAPRWPLQRNSHTSQKAPNNSCCWQLTETLSNLRCNSLFLGAV